MLQTKLESDSERARNGLQKVVALYRWLRWLSFHSSWLSQFTELGRVICDPVGNDRVGPELYLNPKSNRPDRIWIWSRSNQMGSGGGIQRQRSAAKVEVSGTTVRVTKVEDNDEAAVDWVRYQRRRWFWRWRRGWDLNDSRPGCLGSATKAEEELGGGNLEDLSKGEEIRQRRWNMTTKVVSEASGKDDDVLPRVTKLQWCSGEDGEASEGFTEWEKLEIRGDRRLSRPAFQNTLE